MAHINLHSNDGYLFFKKMLVFMPLLILIPLVNSLSQSSSDAEKKMAKKLIRGECLYPQDYPVDRVVNEVLLQRLLVEGRTEAEEVIIFGSSRSRQISLTSYLRKYTSFFNYSMAGAYLQDLIALYALYKKGKVALPKVIILECSAFHLNSGNGQQEGNSYWSFLKNLSIVLASLRDAWSFEMFQIRLRGMYARVAATVKRQSLSKATCCEISWRADGQRVYPVHVDTLRVLQVIKGAKNLHGLEHFDSLDVSATREFEMFIRTLQGDGVGIIFFLPPYHPALYNKLVTNHSYRMVAAAQDFFMQCAKKYNIQVVGSYDPKACACNELDFCDGHHPHQKATGRIFNNILGLL